MSNSLSIYGVIFDGELDVDKDMMVDASAENQFYIDADAALQLIDHLNRVFKIRQFDHHCDSLSGIEKVKVGDLIDMDAGHKLERRKDCWMSWDGGYGIEIPEEEVKEWLK